MDMDVAALSANPPRCPLEMDHTSSAAFTPSGDNFLLSSPYLHRLINHFATTADAGNPAPRSSIESLEEFTITTDSDASMLCPVCKDPFAVDSVAKVMPCKHTYHSDCIVPWLEINNSCPVCRHKLPVAVNEGEGYWGSVRLEELEVDLYGFRHIERLHRWNDESYIASGSIFPPSQIGELERGNNLEAMSSWPRWQAEEIRRGTDETDHAFAQSWDLGEDF
ncbi:RING-H2 finger protein ATL17-like isoform X2 [Salvia hispanica]|uniref:RING-H2 finger protein ATL17-like isoform X2 n=1 Tax=Salvia hispanica TaxID=49212 RepID=UPI0020099E72|nr:RING-H2 finger protein ATL17-like isoform X2 [Salvia hispanica]